MNHAIKQLTVLAALAGAWPLTALTSPVVNDAKEEHEFVKLSPFVVSDSASGAGRYTSFESTSAGRTRVDIMDSSQNVSVITSELIQDVAGSRIVDAARFAAGVTDSSLPTSWERTNMRGFLGDGRTLDGFTFGGYPQIGVMNENPAIIERIEIVKGPSSILAPQPTSPGGTINLATKKPQFRDFGAVNLQWGQFGANSGFCDVNHTASDRLAIRVVASLRDWDNWWQGSYVRSTTVMPGLTYRFSPSVQLTVQYIYSDWKAANYFGLPIDPTSGTTTQAHILAGVPHDLGVYADDAYRADHHHDFRLHFTAELWKGIQMRLAANYHLVSAYVAQLNTGPSTGGTGGNYDPLTGLWNFGLQYSQTPPYAASPLTTLPTRIFKRSGTTLRSKPSQIQIQNDYAYILENEHLKSTTLVGFAYSNAPEHDSISYNIAAPNFDIDHYVDTPWTQGPLNYHNRSSRRFRQAYVSENLALRGNRLILNFAESWQSYSDSVQNLITNASATSSPTTRLPSYGIVIKPYQDAVSFYYSYTEQSSSNGASTTSSVPPLSTAQQREIGARFKVWNNKLYVTVSHFDIIQDNFPTANPGNLVTPPPSPLLPPLFSDRKAKGWEYELRANPNRNLSIIGSYTHFRNRDPNNVEFRGVAEKAGSLLVSYRFDESSIPTLAGFRAAVGIDNLGKRPGDTPVNALTGTPNNPIPNQASFYLGARTLVNLTLAYDSRHHWGVQVNVDNLFDQDYLMASNLRTAVFPGTPRNIRVTLRRSF